MNEKASVTARFTVLARHARYVFLAAALLVLGQGLAHAAPVSHALSPANPSSADNLIVKITTSSCAGFYGKAYSVRAAGSEITIHLTMSAEAVTLCLAGAPPHVLLADVGRLPAGDYRLNIVYDREPNVAVDFIRGYAFKVTDARANKPAPFVSGNASGHWWNPDRDGEGLMIWQDAQDQLLAAWFTYDDDGKAIWYTVQGGQWLSRGLYKGPLLRTAKPTPGVPVALTMRTDVTLDFLTRASTGELIFATRTLNGTEQTQILRRFTLP